MCVFNLCLFHKIESQVYFAFQSVKLHQLQFFDERSIRAKLQMRYVSLQMVYVKSNKTVNGPMDS